MMRTRQEMKSIAKTNLQANYWPCVGALILGNLAIAVASGITSWAGGLAGLVLRGPITIGIYYLFVQVSQGRGHEVNVGTSFQAAFTGFGRKLGGYLWMMLFIFLWSLLFAIPGFIKAYSYALAPYILADCPNVRAKDALKLSMRIMYGRKADLFVLQLSFILWNLLSGLTFGILYVFYVWPYMSNAFAIFYLEAREDALRTGVVTMAELNGEAAVM